MSNCSLAALPRLGTVKQAIFPRFLCPLPRSGCFFNHSCTSASHLDQQRSRKPCFSSISSMAASQGFMFLFPYLFTDTGAWVTLANFPQKYPCEIWDNLCLPATGLRVPASCLRSHFPKLDLFDLSALTWTCHHLAIQEANCNHISFISKRNRPLCTEESVAALLWLAHPVTVLVE